MAGDYKLVKVADCIENSRNSAYMITLLADGWLEQVTVCSCSCYRLESKNPSAHATSTMWKPSLPCTEYTIFVEQ